MQIYPYRTTYDKLEHAHAQIAEAGDTVLSTHFTGGRDWTLICRKGGSVDGLEQLITRAVTAALAAAHTKTSGTLDKVEGAVAQGVARGLRRETQR